MTQTIQQTQQQQSQPVPGLAGDYAERLVRVEKDVGGLRDGLNSLTTQVTAGFKAIGDDLKARSAFNWQPISLLAMVLIAFAGWGWALFGSYQSRTDASIAEQKAISGRFVDRADIADKFQVAKEKNDLRQTMADARVERIERDIEALVKQVVPRGEHETIRQLQVRDYDLLRNRLDRVEGRMEKRTDGLGREVEKLGDRTLSRSEALARNDAQDRAFGVLRDEVGEHNRAFNDRQQRRIDALEMAPRR